MNKLIRDAFALKYLIEGKGTPSLVIGSVDYYPQTFSDNLKNHFQLIFTEHRGFAQSTDEYSQSDYTLDKIVEDIEMLRKELKLDQMVIIGHSGHAHMAVAYAKKYTYHVSKLILIGISPLENQQAANAYFEELASPERKFLLAENLSHMENTFAGRMLAFGPMLWYQYNFDAKNLWSKVHINEDIVNYLWGEVFRTHDLTPDLDLLKMPIDVILGKYDFFNPPNLWKNLQNPFIKIHVLERAGHTPQLEDPEAFDKILVERPQEVNITVELARRLIDSQFPQWSHLPITPVAESGWDNRTFHLGEELSIRLPSAEEYNRQVEKEQKWLPKIAPHLPLPIPQPIARGIPTEEFPWSWSIYQWLEGVSANQLSLSDMASDTIAVQLAQFLSAFHRYDAHGAPVPGLHNWWRAAHTSVYDAETKSLIKDLSEFINADKATSLWNRAISSTWQHDPVWVHGDVASGNILIKDDKISAIIDFGCMGIGDPACDLTIAWTFFKGDSRRLFKENLPLDDETWARARGWALWKALYEMSQLKDKSGDAFEKQRRIIKDLMEDE